MLEIENLTVRYGAVTAVHEVTVNIKQGETVILLGANGAGKSTILKTISGLLKPTSGSITFEGKRIDGASPNAVVKLGIAQVAEGKRIFPEMSVEDNLLVGAFVHRGNSKGVRRDIDEMCQRFPVLGLKLQHTAGSLSGGEQQMLAIAQALMARPRLLMLDEPSLGLAPVIVQEIFQIIRDQKAQGVTILLVEQAALKALDLCDRGYVMQTGEVVLAGSREELRASPGLKDAYLGTSQKSVNEK